MSSIEKRIKFESVVNWRIEKLLWNWDWQAERKEWLVILKKHWVHICLIRYGGIGYLQKISSGLRSEDEGDGKVTLNQ